jgi:predicted RNA binding protein YcfA (HicA-like mRNA interferase family)
VSVRETAGLEACRGSGRLSRLGFEEVRQRGSRKQTRHVDGRGTTVPVHKGKDIAPALLRKILADIGVSAEEFLA